MRLPALPLAGILVAFLAAVSPGSRAPDPLPSWNDGSAKRAIVEFVERSTTEGSGAFLPERDRIAVFDNDGTLWSEQPVYFQLLFAIDRVKELAPQHPEWSDQEPFRSAMRGDLAGVMAGGEHAIVKLVATTHSGMTVDQFRQSVEKWIDAANHPTAGVAIRAMAYQPMLEVLDYMRAHGFRTFIVSGGGVEFMRAFAEKVYGVPPEQVIGSTIKSKFELRDGVPVLVKLPEIGFIDDKSGKPIAIHERIGRRPVAAFGNSDGDLEMLQWTAVSPNHLCVIVHHTDAEREWSYDRASHIGRLDKALDAAPGAGWTVVDMARDWRVVRAK